MKLTDYFIKHPVSSIVLNLALILLGILCFQNIAIREYPRVVLPQVFIETIYPNASAELIEVSVTNILEDELAGVQGVDFIASESTPDMSMITMNFKQGVSIIKAQNDIREAINLAKAKLPKDALNPVIRNEKARSGPPFMAVCLESEAMKFSELTHYVNLNIKNSIRSIAGVASVDVWGRPYTYKIILNNQNMYSYGINADEVFAAIDSSTKSLQAGKYQKEIPVTINLELEHAQDLEKILIKNHPKPVFLQDIAKIELGEDDQTFRLKINGKPGLCIGVNKVSDGNPLTVSDNVNKEVMNLKRSLPKDIVMDILLDQAEYIRSSIHNIQSSVLEAIFLVLIIVFFFLRNLNATLIPVVAIPISLIGALIFLSVFGYSLNIMTLLAMVLAVGLVVDDAIVVLENIMRHIERGESSLNAAINGTKEISFAIIAMTCTLASVYAPIAFIGGVTGQLFTEFAVCLAGSVFISGVTALTLSPLMCAKLIKVQQSKLFPKIDFHLEKLESYYQIILKRIIKQKNIILLLLVMNVLATIVLFKVLPQETVPKEDRGLVGVYVPAIPGKNIDHTEKNIAKVEAIINSVPEREGSITFAFAQGGSAILPLKPKNQRKRSAEEIMGSLFPMMMSFPSADAWPWSWNVALPGIDDPAENSEVTMIVSTTDSYFELLQNLNKLRDEADKRKIFNSFRHDLKLENLGFNIEINKDLAARMKINASQIAKTIEIFFSGDRSINFKKDGILYPLNIEGDYKPWRIEELYVTNIDGNKVSIGNIASLAHKAAPKELCHYNQMKSAKVKVDLSAGDNLSEVMEKMNNLANEVLPITYKKQWYGVAKSYADNASSGVLLMVLSIIFIYAILAVQFNNFIDPFIILFTIPLAAFGALIATYFKGYSLNIYSQVGLITLIGLITKHGILIIEFANQLQEKGEEILAAIIKASCLRLRPILMTTSAMVAGSVPLIFSSSAGSESREAIGLVLVFGLGIGTVFTLFVLPGLYLILKKLNPAAQFILVDKKN